MLSRLEIAAMIHAGLSGNSIVDPVNPEAAAKRALGFADELIRQEGMPREEVEEQEEE